MMWCWHRWTQWKVLQQFIGEYAIGGGQALVTVQQRRCEKCNLVDIRRQDA